MANRRTIKKDINWLLEELIADCLIYLDINQSKDTEPVAKIIDKLISSRDQAFAEINKPSSKRDKKEIKNSYKETISKFLSSASESIDELSKLPR